MTKSFFKPSKAETKQAKAGRMADLIVDRIKAKGECTNDDLLAAGFTEQDIITCGPLARGFAYAELDKKVSRK